MTDTLNLLDTLEALQQRDAALALHEKKDAGAGFLAEARATAEHLAHKNGSVTVDEVRAVVGDPPEECDSRIMGSIFRRGWVKIGYESSRRGVNNGRPVARFTLAGGA